MTSVYANDKGKESGSKGAKKIEVSSTPKATIKPKTKVTQKSTVEPSKSPKVQPTKKPITEKTKGAALSGEGNAVTRDLLYDKATNKQFLTVETRNGKVLYMVIDYDKPVDEDGEQYQTYFLNMVDEQDLQGMLDEKPESTPVVCTCKERCELGGVNTECPLCMQDINKCVGKEKATPEPTETPKQTEGPTKSETSSQSSPVVILLLILALGAGGAVAYYKLVKEKGKAKVPSSLDDYEFEEDEEEEDNYGLDDWEKETDDEE